MKKLLFIFSIISLSLLSSCSKDDSSSSSSSNIGETQPTDKQKVLLSIKNLSETTAITRSTSATDPSAIKKIMYAVYKTGEAITSGNEELVLLDSISVGSTPISNIALDLQPGKYIIAVFASGRTNAEIRTYKQNGKSLLKESYLNIDDITSPTEFYGTTNVEVVKESVTATINLERIVGKVEIVIKDLNNLPANITSVTPKMKAISIYNNSGDYLPWSMRMTSIDASIFTFYQADDAGNGGNSFDILKFNRDRFATHNENNPISFYCLQTATGFGVENFKYGMPYLYLYLNPTNDNPANRILITSQLIIHPNKITRFTGTIVGSNKQGFEISIVDEWKDNPEIITVDKII